MINISSYDEDIKKNIPIGYMNLEDFLKHGWPKHGVIYFTTPIMDTAFTNNNTLEILKEKGVKAALILCPTDYKVVPNEDYYVPQNRL